jgi:hypothetical protein
MCMNCGCGEPDKRHHPTDITREDVQRAADGGGMTLREAARNMQRSSQQLANDGSGQEAGSGSGSATNRA